jgi:hypothetical protein
MSLFHWFTKKKAEQPVSYSKRAGLDNIDVSKPFQSSDQDRPKAQVPPGSPANRKSERLERRELLYTVVRESMIRVGVLSSKYKFKVLSLDSRGSKYLIMMDLAEQHVGEVSRLTEIEGLIAQSAKARHNILVTAVYWRINEHVMSGLIQRPDIDSVPAPLLTPRPPDVTQSAALPKLRHEPLLPDKVEEAFIQALSVAPKPQKLFSPGEIVRSGRKNPTPTSSFADTEFLDEAQMPLSGTQYGNLN